MFGFGSMSHLLVVAALALIFIGPKQLPEVARAIGKLLAELRRNTNMLTDELRAQTMDERNKMRDEFKQMHNMIEKSVDLNTEKNNANKTDSNNGSPS